MTTEKLVRGIGARFAKNSNAFAYEYGTGARFGDKMSPNPAALPISAKNDVSRAVRDVGDHLELMGCQPIPLDEMSAGF
jgi:hypothetical protein